MTDEPSLEQRCIGDYDKQPLFQINAIIVKTKTPLNLCRLSVCASQEGANEYAQVAQCPYLSKEVYIFPADQKIQAHYCVCKYQAPPLKTESK